MIDRQPSHYGLWYWLQYMSPLKRMLLGLLMIPVAIIALITGFLITYWFITLIGILPVAAMYIILALGIIVYLICQRTIRYRHGFSTIQTWDVDAADDEGSTARFGRPQDPGQYLNKNKPNRHLRRP